MMQPGGLPSTTQSRNPWAAVRRTLAAAAAALVVLAPVAPDIARALKEEESAVLRDLKQSIGKDVTVKADVQLHHEQFDVMAV